MKKAILLLAVVGAVGFSSCKKDYTCTCRDSSGDVIATVTYEGVKKSDAEASCEAGNVAGFSTCTLD